MIEQAREPYDWPGILALIHRAFLGMEGRINPPSSLHRLTAEGIAAQALSGEVWVAPPQQGCLFLTPKAGRLYLGKLAVAPEWRGRGLARHLVARAEDRTRVQGFAILELETRVELTENHAIFRKLGFVETGRNAHPGFDRPTSITFAKSV